MIPSCMCVASQLMSVRNPLGNLRVRCVKLGFFVLLSVACSGLEQLFRVHL